MAGHGTILHVLLTITFPRKLFQVVIGICKFLLTAAAVGVAREPGGRKAEGARRERGEQSARKLKENV